MSPLTARSVSMALVGGVAAVLLYSQGFLVWPALIAWAAFLDAGGDVSAVKRTIIGNVFGACLAWVTLLVALNVTFPSDSQMWIPRTAIAIAISLLLLVLATRIEALSRLSTSLYGYAALFGAYIIAVEGRTALEGLTSQHLNNPLILVVVSMVVGAVGGLASNRLAEAMAKK